MWLSCLLSFSSVLALAAEAPPLRPTDWEKTFLSPGPNVLRFTTMASLTAEVPFTIRDYWGREVHAGQGRLVEAFVELDVDLPRGFYEIEMPELDQRFGLVVLEPAAAADPFFCMDAGLSWLLRDDLRGAFIQILRRNGIDVARERLSWGGISLGSDRWNWETGARFDTLRLRYAEQGVKVLEMTHDAPRWMGRVGKYPEDLVSAAAAWGQVVGRWQASWSGVEIWNEPDISFGDFLPGDQYLALVKAIVFAQQQQRCERTLVGGAVAGFNREFLDSTARNGLLDLVDAFSFHTYGRAEQMEALLVQYREWLKAYRRPSLPLWITECGRPWKKGPARPPVAEDAVSALDIVAKAVEARACGVARYFPFVFPYYEEEGKNFGMMGRENTPLRSMAAYCAAARLLAGKQYLGDGKVADAKLRRIRVFGDARESIALLYTGLPDAQATVALEMPIQRAAGIDGRELRVAQGRVPVPDGLTYVWLDRQRLGAALQTDTAAMGMNRVAQEKPAARGTVSPVVLRLQLDADSFTPSPAGYTVNRLKTGKLPLTVRAFNLSDQPLALRLVASSARFGTRWISSQQQAIDVRAQASADARWSVDLSGVLTEAGSVRLLVRAEGPGAGKVVPLSIELLGQPDLKQLLARYKRRVRLPVEQADRWKPQVSAQGTMKLSPRGEDACRLVASFASGDRWVYPQFSLPAEVDPGQYEGLVLEARCEQPASVRVMLWEGGTGVCYLTSQPIIPADGQWHAALVSFRDLLLSTANEPDLNGRLDLKQVRRISIGMNSEQSENALEFREVYLVGN